MVTVKSCPVALAKTLVSFPTQLDVAPVSARFKNSKLAQYLINLLHSLDVPVFDIILYSVPVHSTVTASEPVRSSLISVSKAAAIPALSKPATIESTVTVVQHHHLKLYQCI